MIAGVARSSHPLLNNLGVTIRLLRRQQGLSQEALAHLAKIDRSYMSGIERGRRNVSVLNMERIAVALRVSLSDLLASVAGAHIPPPVSVDRLQRAKEAVDELAETLRIYQSTRTIADESMPGEYLSLS
jgi:transcriptional regulator with XRE-family HTH domain